MCETRANKVLRIQNEIPPIEVHGTEGGLLVVSWGSTYGAVRTGVDAALAEGRQVGHVHLRYLNPLPADLGEVLKRYDRVLVPEMNLGQICNHLRATYLVDAEPLPKVQGQPFRTTEIKQAIDARTTAQAAK
jgi:2-oxoglutarate ferredoxin oxidoreductase subunit alpha